MLFDGTKEGSKVLYFMKFFDSKKRDLGVELKASDAPITVLTGAAGLVGDMINDVDQRRCHLSGAWCFFGGVLSRTFVCARCV